MTNICRNNMVEMQESIADQSASTKDIVVPFDDRRSIRRIVLVAEHLDETAAGLSTIFDLSDLSKFFFGQRNACPSPSPTSPSAVSSTKPVGRVSAA